MASLEWLKSEMQSASKIMDDKNEQFDVRCAARSKFWHCEKRVGTMERNGTLEDDPGHYFLGYSEIYFVPKKKCQKYNR